MAAENFSGEADLQTSGAAARMLTFEGLAKIISNSGLWRLDPVPFSPGKFNLYVSNGSGGWNQVSGPTTQFGVTTSGGNFTVDALRDLWHVLIANTYVNNQVSASGLWKFTNVTNGAAKLNVSNGSGGFNAVTAPANQFNQTFGSGVAGQQMLDELWHFLAYYAS